MRIILFCGILLALAVVDVSADETADRKLIQTARQGWLKAFFGGDTKTMDRLETDEFSVLTGTIVSDKRSQLAGIKEQVDAGKWFPPGFESVDVKVSIRFVGPNVAIVSGHSGSKGPGEKEPRMLFAVTEVWQRSGDEWRVAHLHYHALEDLEPPAPEPPK